MLENQHADDNVGEPRQVAAGQPIDESPTQPADVSVAPEDPVGAQIEEDAVDRPVRPIDPWPGDGGTPIPPLPHGPRPIDHMAGDGGELVEPVAFVVLWDERIPLSPESRTRIERQLRKAVHAELAEQDLDGDLAITTINEPGTRGIRVQRM